MLSSYLNGELPPQQMGLVSLHLQDCPECKRQLSELRQTVAALGRFENRRVSRDFDALLLKRLENLDRVPAASPALSWWHTFAHPRAPWRWAATALAVAAVGVTGWQLHLPAGTADSGPVSTYLTACLHAHETYATRTATAHVPLEDPGPDLELPDEATE